MLWCNALAVFTVDETRQFRGQFRKWFQKKGKIEQGRGFDHLSLIPSAVARYRVKEVGGRDAEIRRGS